MKTAAIITIKDAATMDARGREAIGLWLAQCGAEFALDPDYRSIRSFRYWYRTTPIRKGRRSSYPVAPHKRARRG